MAPPFGRLRRTDTLIDIDASEATQSARAAVLRAGRAAASAAETPRGSRRGSRRSRIRLASRSSTGSPARTRSACDSRCGIGLSQPTVSHHLRVLREAGLIEVARKRGTWVFYRLVPEAVEQLAFALGGRRRPSVLARRADGAGELSACSSSASNAGPLADGAGVLRAARRRGAVGGLAACERRARPGRRGDAGGRHRDRRPRARRDRATRTSSGRSSS